MAMALGTGAAFAQAGGPIDPGVWTTEFVHHMAPFLTPTVTIANINNTAFDVAGFLTPLDDAALLEVRQRCSVIVMTPAGGRPGGASYTAETVAFCNTVFAWVAANKPNAPNTEAVLFAPRP